MAYGPGSEERQRLNLPFETPQLVNGVPTMPYQNLLGTFQQAGQQNQNTLQQANQSRAEEAYGKYASLGNALTQGTQGYLAGAQNARANVQAENQGKLQQQQYAENEAKLPYARTMAAAQAQQATALARESQINTEEAAAKQAMLQAPAKTLIPNAPENMTLAQYQAAIGAQAGATQLQGQQIANTQALKDQQAQTVAGKLRMVALQSHNDPNAVGDAVNAMVKQGTPPDVFANALDRIDEHDLTKGILQQQIYNSNPTVAAAKKTEADALTASQAADLINTKISQYAQFSRAGGVLDSKTAEAMRNDIADTLQHAGFTQQADIVRQGVNIAEGNTSLDNMKRQFGIALDQMIRPIEQQVAISNVSTDKTTRAYNMLRTIRMNLAKPASNINPLGGGSTQLQPNAGPLPSGFQNTMPSAPVFGSGISGGMFQPPVPQQQQNPQSLPISFAPGALPPQGQQQGPAPTPALKGMGKPISGNGPTGLATPKRRQQ